MQMEMRSNLGSWEVRSSIQKGDVVLDEDEPIKALLVCGRQPIRCSFIDSSTRIWIFECCLHTASVRRHFCLWSAPFLDRKNKVVQKEERSC